MAASSSSSQGSVKEYIVRIPKITKKRYHMMRFSAELGNDFFKSWTQCKMERENNLREYRLEEEIPKFGAGSEYGREQREEARRKRFGINVKKYRSEDQPWMLSIGGKSGKKFKGIREGGVNDNVAWYVFMQGKDGAFEAYPIDEWYNFQPIQRYKALSAEEAEEEFIKRDKIMNYFQVMTEKKFRKENGDIDEDEVKKKGGKKHLILSEMDDWVSDDEDDDDERDDEEEDEEGGKKKRKKKKFAFKKKQTGGKKKKGEGGESDDSCIEESDEYNEGVEHDYISSDSSDSDQENEEVVTKELTGVEEGDALKKLLASDDEDEEEEKDKEQEEEEEKNKEEEPEEKEKKKKKKKKDKKSDKDSEESSASSGDDSKKNKERSKNSERKHAVNELKRKVKENLQDAPDSKKAKLDLATGGSGAGAMATSDSMEEAIRRYLMRKPMTTTELLKNFKKKKDMSSVQLVTTIAQILKRVNPVKTMIKGKMYLSLKSS